MTNPTVTPERSFSDSKKRGCPTCDGVDVKTCMRCLGRTRLCDWRVTVYGYRHIPKADQIAGGDE